MVDAREQVHLIFLHSGNGGIHSYWSNFMRFLDAARRWFVNSDEDIADDYELEHESEGEFSENKKLLQHPMTPKADVHIVRPTLDQHGNPNFSLIYYKDLVKSGKGVILDLSDIIKYDAHEGRRIVDYLTGVADTCDGSVKKLTDFLFLITSDTFTIQVEY